MEPQDLVKVWDAPDNSRLTPKQLSIRLPLLVSARISALCDLYPRKTKTEIIGDLLSTALDQLESALPSMQGEQVGINPYDDEPVYEDVGPRGRFNTLTERYLRELEKEAGIKEPMPFAQEKSGDTIPISTNQTHSLFQVDGRFKVNPSGLLYSSGS